MTARPSFLCGLIGAGIQGSRSPALHEEEADLLGLRYIYKLIDLDELKVGIEALPALLLAAERMGFAGLNITHPCKQVVIPLLHELSEEAKAVGRLIVTPVSKSLIHVYRLMEAAKKPVTTTTSSAACCGRRLPHPSRRCC